MVKQAIIGMCAMEYMLKNDYFNDTILLSPASNFMALLKPYQRKTLDSMPTKGVLKYNRKDVGAVLRTRYHVKPVFVSPGHLIDLKTSMEIVLACTGKFRIPEPLRRADNLSKKLRKTYNSV